jgi:hypothetical protein
MRLIGSKIPLGMMMNPPPLDEDFESDCYDNEED